ncbi:MAG: DCC1-like thiol-disulfide oxidoreductase family protein [Acidobacteriota bacterium]|nr:DCC1-like thiol-disulfide oxidoreductase family protein [Acidobacteriota bacterium]
MALAESNPIVLYDGVCGLCNRLNQFLLKRDTHDRLRFASLQSNFAAAVLLRHGADPHDLDTVYVVVDYGQPTERLLSRSDAILYLLAQLGGIWKLGSVGHILPRVLRDGAYGIVARNRYRVFGKYDSCMLPEPKHRAKFLEV